MTRLSDRQLRRARASAHWLTGRVRRGAPDVVRHLLAVQAQDIGSAPLGLRARATGLTAADVAAARHDRSVVRAWGPRGTLHLIAREDLGWLTSLVRRTSVTHVMTRLRQEGITGEVADLLSATEVALAGQGPLTKAQVGTRLARRGVDAHGQAIVYLAFLACLHGRAVLGPDAGNKPTYVHAADWLGDVIRPERDADRALAELARRYLVARGPAGPEDLAAWTKLPLRDARSAFRLAADDLREVETSTGPMWCLRRPAPGRAAPLRLLPAFDEYLLSWRDRGLVLPERYAKRVCPGGGVIRPVVVVDGTVVGTWRQGTGAVELFGDAPAGALRRETADAARFLAAPKGTAVA